LLKIFTLMLMTTKKVVKCISAVKTIFYCDESPSGLSSDESIAR